MSDLTERDVGTAVASQNFAISGPSIERTPKGPRAMLIDDVVPALAVLLDTVDPHSRDGKVSAAANTLYQCALTVPRDSAPEKAMSPDRDDTWFQALGALLTLTQKPSYHAHLAGAIPLCMTFLARGSKCEHQATAVSVLCNLLVTSKDRQATFVRGGFLSPFIDFLEEVEAENALASAVVLVIELVDAFCDAGGLKVLTRLMLVAERKADKSFEAVARRRYLVLRKVITAVIDAHAPPPTPRAPLFDSVTGLLRNCNGHLVRMVIAGMLTIVQRGPEGAVADAFSVLADFTEFHETAVAFCDVATGVICARILQTGSLLASGCIAGILHRVFEGQLSVWLGRSGNVECPIVPLLDCGVIDGLVTALRDDVPTRIASGTRTHRTTPAAALEACLPVIPSVCERMVKAGAIPALISVVAQRDNANCPYAAVVLLTMHGREPLDNWDVTRRRMAKCLVERLWVADGMDESSAIDVRALHMLLVGSDRGVAVAAGALYVLAKGLSLTIGNYFYEIHQECLLTLRTLFGIGSAFAMYDVEEYAEYFRALSAGHGGEYREAACAALGFIEEPEPWRADPHLHACVPPWRREEVVTVLCLVAVDDAGSLRYPSVQLGRMPFELLEACLSLCFYTSERVEPFVEEDGEYWHG